MYYFLRTQSLYCTISQTEYGFLDQARNVVHRFIRRIAICCTQRIGRDSVQRSFLNIHGYNPKYWSMPCAMWGTLLVLAPGLFARVRIVASFFLQKVTPKVTDNLAIALKYYYTVIEKIIPSLKKCKFCSSCFLFLHVFSMIKFNK